MDHQTAVRALAALAHEHRLAIARLLVRQGPNGMAAGEIGDRLGVSPTGMSFHLKELDRAGLVRSWREGRSVRYAIQIEGMRQLIEFLTEDCCQGQPEICGHLGEGHFSSDCKMDES